jgi:hypothetical protein
VFFGTVAGAGETTLAVEFLAGGAETGETVAAGEFESVGTVADSGLVVGRLLTATVWLGTGASTAFTAALPDLTPCV